MDFLSLGGVVVSFVAMVSHDYRNCVVFAVLWAFYLSLYQVGQTFICCQWDLLLLEAGFLAVIVAPLNFFGLHDIVDHHAHDRITLWLVKWLLFRLTFASGVVKLLSNSATWWSLTAMKHHYETQLLPTPIAWLFHQFPDWWHRLSTAAILVIQIPVALFFFSPSKNQRHLALYCQVAHMLLLVLTGNFGSFPLLVLTLCLSLVDDDFIEHWFHQSPKAEKDHPKESRSCSDRLRTLDKVFSIITYVGLLFLILYSFSFNIRTEPISLEPEIAFTPDDLDWFLSYALPLTTILGAASLAWEIGSTIFKVLTNKQSRSKSKVKDLTGCAFFGLIALALFLVSLVPHVVIGKDSELFLPETLQDAYSWTSQNYHLTNPYNLFLKTDEEAKGRLEIVLEGSNKLRGNWKEYHFRYKPDDVKSKLSIVAPHYPRLDSQMWYAARGHYDQNPWFLNLAYRLLRNQREVLELMDGDNPFPNKPPKYVRAILYRYRFASKATKTDKFAASDWWVREPVREYMPPLTLDEPSFIIYLMDAGIYAETEKLADAEEERNLFYGVLEDIRSMLGQGSGNIVCIFLLVSGFILTLVDPCIKLPTEEEQLANGVTSHGLCNK